MDSEKRDLILKKFGVHCKTEDMAIQVLKILDSLGGAWGMHKRLPLSKETNFGTYGVDTCYFVEYDIDDEMYVMYGDEGWAKEEGIRIITSHVFIEQLQHLL